MGEVSEIVARLREITEAASPGPWAVRLDESNFSANIQEAEPRRQCEHIGRFTCSHRPSWPQRQADGRLAALSPLLLQASEALANAMAFIDYEVAGYDVEAEEKIKARAFFAAFFADLEREMEGA